MKITGLHKILMLLAIIFVSDMLRAETVQKQTLAPGYESLQFEPSPPGSYELPVLGRAADGDVLDSDGSSFRLHQKMGDKMVLLSFIYSTCGDINGCPLATAVFHKIKNRVQKQPELADQLRLLTLSFNPTHDTPDVMKHYGQGLANENLDWHFLTTRSELQLQPILDHYKQNIQRIYDQQGRNTDTFSHNLRVYLIDKRKQIRNIYSVAFLHPDTLVNDIKTLVQEELSSQKAHTKQFSAIDRFVPGDNKSDYETKSYATKSVALTDRVGHEANLLKTISHPVLGLPPVPMSSDNPATKEKIALGRKLFYDRRLSFNNTFSCAMCHIPEQGFTSNEMATAVGVEGRTIRRNSPTLYNVAYSRSLFHDGRETALEQQIWGPLLAHNEMANPSIGFVIDKINRDVDYRHRFQRVFGKSAGMESIGMAIASYERTLNSANSAFDRWHYGKNKSALNDQAQRGFKLFTGKAGCAGCHTLTKHHALFTDNDFHNTGVGYREAMNKTATNGSSNQRVQVAPGTYVEVASSIIDAISETVPNDMGRYEVTQKPEDRWKYKTPTLRNIGLTAPYMHNGSLATLQQVVQFYDRGGHANENLDPLIKPLKLTESEQDELIVFLQSLTGDNVNELVSDAFSAPIGDAK
ncbi:MAG: photosynthetic protein synthase I [Methylococcaceae bacterium]|nr:photosynthetic protein synthase I [Methylococcaceae bacterium]